MNSVIIFELTIQSFLCYHFEWCMGSEAERTRFSLAPKKIKFLKDADRNTY